MHGDNLECAAVSPRNGLNRLYRRTRFVRMKPCAVDGRSR